MKKAVADLAPTLPVKVINFFKQIRILRAFCTRNIHFLRCHLRLSDPGVSISRKSTQEGTVRYASGFRDLHLPPASLFFQIALIIH